LAGIPFRRKLLNTSIPKKPGFANFVSPAGISPGSARLLDGEILDKMNSAPMPGEIAGAQIFLF
jgi:hypothetical protein